MSMSASPNPIRSDRTNMKGAFSTAAVAVSILLAGFMNPPDHRAEIVTFRPDRTHSNLGFKVRHLGISNVRGSFIDYDAVVRFDPEDLSTLAVDATIEVASISTENERRDNHLRSDDFFNAEQYPTMRFVSKGIRSIAGSEFELVGDLTIRDVTKEVVLEGEFFGIGATRNGRKAGFEAGTTVNRFDYNLRWDSLTEVGGLVVGEDVEIIIEMELNEESQG